MDEISISEIQIIPIKPKDGLVAFASCVINNKIYLGNLAVYSSLSSPEGFRLVYPSKTLKNGIKLSICYPINREAGVSIQRAIIAKYEELVEKVFKQNEKTNPSV